MPARHRLLALTCASGLVAGCAMMNATDTPAMRVDGAWVGPNGMALYTFDRDTAGVGQSACSGSCAANWPPLIANDAFKAGGDWSVINRDDGRKQWALKGKPLYYRAKDSKPGDRSGDGSGNVWHLAK